MSLATITPAQRVMLDRRIAEEAMLALDPPWLVGVLEVRLRPAA